MPAGRVLWLRPVSRRRGACVAALEHSDNLAPGSGHAFAFAQATADRSQAQRRQDARRSRAPRSRRRSELARRQSSSTPRMSPVRMNC